MRNSDHVISAAGLEFYSQQRGDHPGVIFLHGFGGDLHIWDGVWAQLGEDVSALRYDLRDFGQSPCSNDETFAHADDLLAILDALVIEHCDLVGSSMGGGIALNFALDHPERVNKMVLISPSLVAWEWSPQWQALWEPIVNCAQSGQMNKARQLWWQHPLFATTRESNASSQLHDSIMSYSGAQWVRDNQCDAMPEVERLYTLQVPTLLLSGESDLPDFRLIADLIEAAVPNLRRVDLPKRGHMLPLETPETCAQHIVRFLTAD